MGQQYRQLQLNLDNFMGSGEAAVPILTPGKSSTITGSTKLKIWSLEKLTPCTVRFVDKTRGGAKANFVVHCSLTESNPNSKNCDKSFYCPSKVVVDEIFGKPRFEAKVIYLAIEITTGGALLSVLARFPDPSSDRTAPVSPSFQEPQSDLDRELRPDIEKKFKNIIDKAKYDE